MGSGIATAFILSDIVVVLKEVNEKFLNTGINRIKGEFFLPWKLLLRLSLKFIIYSFFSVQPICRVLSKRDE